MDDIWFQQVGAACHTAEVTIDLLRTVFENRIISQNSDINWHTHTLAYALKIYITIIILLYLYIVNLKICKLQLSEQILGKLK